MTRQHLIISRNLVEKQNNQRALENKNKSSKQTQDIKLAENFSPITRKLEEINEFTKKIEVFKKSDVEDGKTQTPAIQNVTGTQSLRVTLALMKRSNFFSNYLKKIRVKYFGIVCILNNWEEVQLVLKMKSMV